jgi:hypothetical protein
MRNNTELQSKMFGLVQRWQQSGMSKRTFCEQHSVSYFNFQYWHKKYRGTSNSGIQSGFVPLGSGLSIGDSFCTLHFPGGAILDIHHPVSPDFLSSLLR